MNDPAVPGVRDKHRADRPPRWVRQGYSSHEEALYHRQNHAGTNSGRYRPQHRDPNPHQARAVSSREASILDTIYEALDATVERESAYPKDGDANHLYAVGETLTIRMGGRDYRVELIQRWSIFDRLRYRIRFVAEDVSIAVTQAQLVRLHVKPLVTVAPTHLLPAVVERAGECEHRLHGATFSSLEAFNRAKARLAANWKRQLGKVQTFETPFLGTLAAHRK